MKKQIKVKSDIKAGERWGNVGPQPVGKPYDTASM